MSTLSPGSTAQTRYRIRERIRKLRSKGTIVGDNCQIWGYVDEVFPHLVTIGRNCILSGKSAIITHDPIKGGNPVVIEDNVFVGYGAIVLPGVVIGDGSIVGAGAVVTNDVDRMTVVCGNPARFLRKRNAGKLAEYVDARERGDVL